MGPALTLAFRPLHSAVPEHSQAYWKLRRVVPRRCRAVFRRTALSGGYFFPVVSAAGARMSPADQPLSIWTRRLAVTSSRCEPGVFGCVDDRPLTAAATITRSNRTESRRTGTRPSGSEEIVAVNPIGDRFFSPASLRDAGSDLERTKMTLHYRCKRPFICSFAIVMAFASAISGAQGAQVPGRKGERSVQWREAQSCGVACGYLLTRFLDQAITYDEASAAIRIHSGGTSLEDLKKGLDSLGAEVSVVRAKPSDLESIRMPVIAHTLPREETVSHIGHYLFVLKVTDHFVWYIEPNYAASIEKVTRNRFLRCWSGYLITPKAMINRGAWGIDLLLSIVLAATIVAGLHLDHPTLVSRLRRRHCPKVVVLLVIASFSWGCGPTPLSLVGSSETGSEEWGRACPCQLIVETTDVDVGVLPEYGVATARFAIENAGALPVQLQLGAPTCRCTEVAIDKYDLKPGEATCIRMSMRSIAHTAGPSEAQVYVAAEDQKWATTLHIHGVQCGARFLEYRYALGGPTASRRATIKGNLFVRNAETKCSVIPSLAGTGLDQILQIEDVRISDPILRHGYVERTCSFAIAMRSTTAAFPVIRQNVMLPVAIRLGDSTMTQHVALAVLTTSVASQH